MQRNPVLEIRNRKGNAALRAEGPAAVYAAVALRHTSRFLMSYRTPSFSDAIFVPTTRDLIF